MGTKRYVMGLFTEEDRVVSTLADLKASAWKLHDVHGPYPSHRILDALKMPKSKVGLFTLGGGILGMLSGYGLAIFTAVQWKLIVSGKPVVAPIPFFVVGYEMTILFGVLGTVLGLLLTAKLPEFKSLKLYDERCSGEHFGVVAVCDPGGEAELSEFFRERGGEARTLEDPAAAAATT